VDVDDAVSAMVASPNRHALGLEVGLWRLMSARANLLFLHLVTMHPCESCSIATSASLPRSCTASSHRG
jgi:hypothetical protein